MPTERGRNRRLARKGCGKERNGDKTEPGSHWEGGAKGKGPVLPRNSWEM